MIDNNVSICKKVILETIDELKKEEKTTKFASDSFKIMEQIITLKETLKIIKD